MMSRKLQALVWQAQPPQLQTHSTDLTPVYVTWVEITVIISMWIVKNELICLVSLVQILSQANQSQSQQHAPPPSALSSSSQIPPPPSLPPPPGLSPAQFILHGSLPLVSCTKTPPSHLHPSIGGGCAQTPPSILPVGMTGVTGSSSDPGWDNESKDPDKVKMRAVCSPGWRKQSCSSALVLSFNLMFCTFVLLLLLCLTCAYLHCAVPEEAAYAGASSRGGEACYQTLLSTQRHQQGRIQRHPEESSA